MTIRVQLQQVSGHNSTYRLIGDRVGVIAEGLGYDNAQNIAELLNQQHKAKTPRDPGADVQA